MFDFKLNCLSHWFPLIEAAGLPVPRTVILRDSADIADRVAEAVSMLGPPAFLRTGQGSGKHDWERCCFVNSCERHVVWRHIAALRDWSECVDILGLPCDVWAVREMLPVRPLFRCRAYGNMPVVREVRCFVDGARVVSVNPYWPPKALRMGDPSIEDWHQIATEMNTITAHERDQYARLASRAGSVVGGRWSVDILETSRGLYVTDMAIAERSFGYDEEAYNED